MKAGGKGIGTVLAMVVRRPVRERGRGPPDREEIPTDPGEVPVEVLAEQTLFMRRATYYIRRFLAASGLLELTNQHVNFTPNSLDSNFGIKDLSLDLDEIEDVRVRSVGFSGRLEIQARGQIYRFALSRAEEFYNRLKEVRGRWFSQVLEDEDTTEQKKMCSCGRRIHPRHKFCPWCGTKTGA
jgi:hypothetical protein